MERFISKIKELDEFANITTIGEYEELFKSLFKKRCGKCKRVLLNDCFACKSNGETFKLCTTCREIMKNIMTLRKNNHPPKIVVEVGTEQ